MTTRPETARAAEPAPERPGGLDSPGVAPDGSGECGGASVEKNLVAGGSTAALLIESVLFVADQPVALADLARALEIDRTTVDRALDELSEACRARGVRLQRTNGRVQMVTAPEAASAVHRFLGLDSTAKLSRAALETLAMIAYRQPITRPEIDDLRGVDSDHTLRTLLARGLVEPTGRRPTVGRPIEYGTTFLFLEYFGLASLEELPAVGAFSQSAAASDEPEARSRGNGRSSAGDPAPAAPLLGGAESGGTEPDA